MFYDLVIEVAIVRPVRYRVIWCILICDEEMEKRILNIHPKNSEEILERTLGVPLFQEQAMKIAIVGAGFTPAEADELRRSMATFKVKGHGQQVRSKADQWHDQQRVYGRVCTPGLQTTWKVLAAMVFPKAMRQVLHYWYMFRAGSNVIIPMIFATADP